MSLKLAFSRLTLIITLLLTIAAIAAAKPPTLDPIGGFPGELQPGEQFKIDLRYTQSEGDAPASLNMILDAPDGQITVPAHITPGDPKAGIDVTWTYAPKNVGSYTYHFEATSSTGAAVRYPETADKDLKFTSTSLVTKYIILAVGLLVALMFLPFVVYLATRSINKRGNPASAARVALLVGVLVSYALFLYLFYTIYSLPLLASAGVAALGVLIVLFTRK